MFWYESNLSGMLNKWCFIFKWEKLSNCWNKFVLFSDSNGVRVDEDEPETTEQDNKENIQLLFPFDTKEICWTIKKIKSNANHSDDIYVQDKYYEKEKKIKQIK